MLITLITFLFTLSVLVLVHELGHFLVAKRSGIKVEEFGFGLPPRIWGKKIGETIYSLNWLPIGGFVKLAGEDGQTGREGEKAREQEGREFWAKPKRVRTAVLVAGVTMNFVLAIVLFSFIYIKIGIPTETNRVKVIGIAKDSPSQMVGLKLDDVIVSAGGEKVESTEDFKTITKKYAGRSMDLEVVRGQNMVFTVIPRVSPPKDEGPLGVIISQTEMKFFPWWQMPLRGTMKGVEEAFNWTHLILKSLVEMVSQLIRSGTVPRDIAGPVGIFQVSGEAAKTGMLGIMNFIAILSINLGVLNILPFPALDGGRLMFVGFEAVTGKKGNGKVERLANNLGMAFLLFLFLLITINDIARILETSGILQRITSILSF